MAEAPDSEPVPSSSESAIACNPKDDEEPSAKKRRISEKESDKLEHRLGGILCCAVCLDLPQAAVYQCSNGHLMCAPCFTHLLADARLRDEAATCPNCRVEISKTSASRNLAVEKTVSELPSECKYCTKVFPRHSLQHHEDKTCEERFPHTLNRNIAIRAPFLGGGNYDSEVRYPCRRAWQYKFAQIVVNSSVKPRYVDSLIRIVSSVYALMVGALRRVYLVSEVQPSTAKRRRYRRLTGCRYACIGCGWRGPAHEARGHEAQCAHPRGSAADVVAVLAAHERRAADSLAVYKQLLDLLSYEQITINDLQLKPYRTEEFVHKLYYETSRFTAFSLQWVVKAFVNKNQRDPTQSSQREITYQVILKSKTVCPVCVQWVCLRGPYGEARVLPRPLAHAFHEADADAPPQPLPLHDLADTNRLLANKAIHFRLIMFLTSK